MKIKKINEDVIKTALMCIEALETQEVRYDMDEYYYYDETIDRLKTLIKEAENINKRIDLIEKNEMKNKIELTSDEVVILKNIDKKYKYIARHRNNAGSLSVFEKEQIKGGRYYEPRNNKGWQYLSAFYHLFQSITFESGAHLIADLIKENEK